MTPEWCYGDDPGEPHGPLTWEQLKGDAASGRIGLHALIWRENGSEQKRAWTVQQLMVACLSDRQLRDEESYIRLRDENEADGDWDDTIDFDEAAEDGGDFDLDPEEDELARKVASAPTIVPRKALVGHEAGVTSLAFRLGARPLRLASGSFDGTVRLWDIRTERMLACLKGHRDTIEVVAFSPTQPLLASASRDGSVRLWDLTGHERQSATWEHGAPVTALAFSPDGKVIVTGGHDGTIRWWDVRTGMQAHCVEARNPVESLCLTPDGATIISTHAPKLVRRWDFASAEEIRPDGYPSRVVQGCNIVACSPDGAKFAVAGNMKTLGDISVEEMAFEVRQLGHVSIWDVPALTERRFWAHTGEGFSVAFSPDGGLLASTGADGATRVWDASDLSLYGTLGGHRSSVYAVTFTPGGRFIVTGGEDATIHIYDTSFAYLERGKGRLASGGAKSAVADFTKAIRAGRGGRSQEGRRVQAEARFESGKARLRMGDVRRATCDLKKAIRGDECFADACRSQGDDLFESGRFKEAEACFTAVIEEARRPQSQEFGVRGLCRMRRRAYRKAIPDFTDAIRFEDDFLPVCHEFRGIAHYRVGLLDEAILDFGRALELYLPNEGHDACVSLFVRRGRVWMAKHRPDQAIRDYSAALDLCTPEKERIKLLQHRGRAYYQIWEYSRAIEDFTSAIGLVGDPPDGDGSAGDQGRAWLHVDRGRALVGQCKYGEAIVDFVRAVVLDSSERTKAEALCGSGKARYQSQDYYAAIRDYTRAIQLVPDLAHGYEGRALVYWRLGRDDRAALDRIKAEELRQRSQQET